MTFSLFDHPHFQSLLGREDLAALFAAEAEVKAILRFEAALAEAQAEANLIPRAAAAAIGYVTGAFQGDVAALAAGVARDGLVVPVLIEHVRKNLEEAHRPHLHLGATSQDVIDTGLMLRLKEACALLCSDIDGVAGQLDTHARASGQLPFMARTRMQHALQVTVADRIGIWKGPLERHRAVLDGFCDDVFAVQFAGPVGTLDKLQGQGPHVRKVLAGRLALADPGGSWHTDRSRIADIAHWLAKVSGSLGKIGQDVALMAQNEVGEVVIEGGGQSSAMAHKRNPIRAELLVTLARYNAVELGAIQQAMVHEGERSGSAWTLEWLALPTMVATTGAALKLAKCLLDALVFPDS